MSAPTLAQQPQAAKQAAPVAQVLAAYGAWQAGTSTFDEFTQTVTGLLAVTRTRLAILADAAVVSALQALGRRDALPVGLVPDDLSERDTQSLETVTEEPETAEMRLARFIEATSLEYGHDAAVEAMGEHDIDEWRWVTPDPDACDYCRPRDGKIFSVTQQFRDHPNCECYPEPIIEYTEEEVDEND